jgi:hypothetical protein
MVFNSLCHLSADGLYAGKQNVDVILFRHSNALLDCGCGRADLWLADVSAVMI